jgi:Na+-driven multidrug efflux pump
VAQISIDIHTEIANSGLKIYFAGYFFAGVNIVFIAFLSAVSQSKPAMLLSVLRSCVFLVPFVLLLSMIFGTYGVWLSFVITEVLVFLISVFWLMSFKKI